MCEFVFSCLVSMPTLAINLLVLTSVKSRTILSNVLFRMPLLCIQKGVSWPLINKYFLSSLYFITQYNTRHCLFLIMLIKFLFLTCLLIHWPTEIEGLSKVSPKQYYRWCLDNDFNFLPFIYTLFIFDMIDNI